MSQAMDDLLNDEDLERMLAAASVCFDASVMEILGTLSLGETVVLANNMLDLSALDSAATTRASTAGSFSQFTSQSRLA